LESRFWGLCYLAAAVVVVSVFSLLMHKLNDPAGLKVKFCYCKDKVESLRLSCTITHNDGSGKGLTWKICGLMFGKLIVVQFAA